MDLSKAICTSTDTYYVTFINSVNLKYIVKYTDISEPLKQLNNGLFLDAIWRFNPSKMKFDKVAKKNYNTLFGWDTECIELLRKHKIVK